MEKIHIRDLPTLSTEALEEMLERQNRILGKRLYSVFALKLIRILTFPFIFSCVMCKLIDKGESVRKFHSAILTELNKRKTDNKLSESLSELNIKNPAGDAEGQTERHIQYVCAKESLKPIEHFRPFAIAKHEKENRQGTSNEAATVEPRHTFHTKLIPLNESLVLQKDQAKRVKVN